MLEPHLIVQFRVNAIAWLLLPISISFYTFKGRERTRYLIRKPRGHADCRKLETGGPLTPSHCFRRFLSMLRSSEWAVFCWKLDQVGSLALGPFC
jgi:hypothetical protein